MIIGRSNMHAFQNIALFESDVDLDHPDTISIFSKENLAPNLVIIRSIKECTLEAPQLKDLIAQTRSEKKTNIIKVSIAEEKSKYDLQIQYRADLIKRITVDLLRDELSRNKFNIKISENSNLPLIPGFDSDSMHYIDIAFNRNFINEKSKELSEFYRKSFSSERYVDSNIAYFFVSAILSATAEKWV